ncbi:hypothetical protein L204_101390 [Cryptococcus depauperatus]|nr:hypothetical protein L204_04060 [Cryptococcus depauperatus CBS 7855]
MSTNYEDELQSILPDFVGLVRSPTPISLPPQILLGAITHFLSRLRGQSLQRFCLSLMESESLWNIPNISCSEVRDAIRLSVLSLVTVLEEKDVSFKAWRMSRMARQWLEDVVKATSCVSLGIGKAHFLVGLIQGFDNVDASAINWGNSRIKVEEFVVLDLAKCMEMEQDKISSILFEALPYVDLARLRTLDVLKLIEGIECHLYDEINPDRPKEDLDSSSDADGLGRALSRAFKVLASGGPSSRLHALESMQRFCSRMRATGERLEMRQQNCQDGQISEIPQDLSFNINQNDRMTFSVLLIPTFTIVETLQDVQSHETASFAIELVTQILISLASFAFLGDSNVDDYELYYRVLYGCLDFISERGDVHTSENLFSTLKYQRMTNARSAYILLLGDELIHQLGNRSIGLLLPLAEKHAHRPEHQHSFDAAHALFLTLLKSSSEGLQTDNPQAAFFDCLLPNYLKILIKQANSDNITSDQLIQALPQIASYASARNFASVSMCLHHLSALPSSLATHIIEIRVAPYIATHQLPIYLERIAESIMSFQQDSEERLKLMSEAFKMVSQDLRDDLKVLGAQWWLKWKDEFEGKQGKFGFWRSRL